MTDKQRAAMKDIIDSTAVRSALYLINYCKEHYNHCCEGCCFEDNTMDGCCKLASQDIRDVTYSKHWEVDNEILHR